MSDVIEKSIDELEGAQVENDVDEENDENDQSSTPANFFGKPYASPTPPFDYYVELLCIGLQSAIIGLFSLGYLNIVYEVPKLWMSYDGNENYPKDPDTVQFAAGKPLWIAIGTAAGLVVGFLRAYVFHLDEYASFIEELSTLHSNPREGVKVCILCLLSLMGGASVGPEAGLGASCGVIAHYWSIPVKSICKWVREKTIRNDMTDSNNEDESKQQEEQHQIRSKLLVLSGFASAFSSFLPSPAASILLCLELIGFEELRSRHGMAYMRTIGILTFAGTISFLVYRALEDNTYLPSATPSPGFLHRYSNNDIATAMGLGVMGSCLALAYFIVAALVKKTAAKLRSALTAKLDAKIVTVFMGTFGGALVGTLGYLFPLTVGDGSYQIGAVVVHGGKYGNSILVASAFVKMLTYWISAECGFVGGLFFPLLISSTMMGRVFVNITDASWAVGMACSLVAMASAITPMPLAMMVVGLSTFNLDALGFVPLLLCPIVAHVLLVGIGVPQAMVKLAAKSNENKTNNDSKPAED